MVYSNSKEKSIKYRIFNDAGLSVSFSNYGARITSVQFNNKQIARNGFVSGRFANRIKGASFLLNRKRYLLDQNEGQNHLHGGKHGFSKKYWEVKKRTASSITFSLLSPDGDMGYPGNLDISVTYTLTSASELIIEYHATSDKDTILNPINHLYFANKENDLKLSINASAYTEKGKDRVPTGRILPTKNTKYDFETLKKLERNESYDINYVLNGQGFRQVACLTSKQFSVDVYTDRPGLQLYQTKKYVCLEAQMFPDAINHENFPSPIIKKDTAFYSKTVYHFNYFK